MRAYPFTRLCLLGLAIGMIIPSTRGFSQTAQAAKVVFSNVTAGEQANSNIWINLVGGGFATNAANLSVFSSTTAIGTYLDSAGTTHDLFTNSSLNLLDITNNGVAAINITNWDSGRLYVSYGAGFTGLSESYTPTTGPYAGWQPAPAQPDPNFQIRHQAMELTVLPSVVAGTFTNTTQMFADVSYIDYAAISLGLKVVNAPAGATNTTQATANGSTLLGAVAGTNPSAPTYTPNSNILTVGYVSGTTPIVQVAGQNTEQTYQNATNFPAPNGPVPSPNFLRVAGPASMGTIGSGTGPTAYYNDWSVYIGALQSGGTLNADGNLVTTLSGTWNQQVVYDMTAVFSSDTVTIGGTEYEGYVTISGTMTQGGTETPTTIIIPNSQLQASTGIYGANPNYELNGSGVLVSEGNDQYTQTIGDLMAGMNFGYVGSTVENPLGEGTIGEATSAEWWLIGNYKDTPGVVYQYGGVQSDSNYYNWYAGQLLDVTSGYGFAYGDRLGSNTTQYNLNPDGSDSGAYLEILIQPDFAPVPEPSTWALLGLGGGLLFFMRRRRCSQA